MTALTSAKLSTPGGGLAITSQVSNQGLGVVASDFEVGYYLSPDSTITTSDRIMTQVCIVHGIGQGTNLSCEGVLTVPVDTPNGTYYFGAIVDRLNVVSETNEANNTILASTGTVVIQTPCPEGTACNDGVYCNGTDTCSGGACSVHAGNPCPGADGDGNCAESCNEATDTCSAADPNGSTCNDGAYCNGTDSCSGGACSVHGGNPCPGADGDANCAESCNEATDTCSAADPNGSACNDGAYCNGSDTCSGGACSVHGGNPCPGADGDANCAESCNETTDGCNAFDPSGSSCNDSDQCTANDSCKNGQCSGQVTPECPSTTTTTLPGQVCGDANGDGKITTSDALIVLRSAVGTANCLMTVCDFSGDGKVTSADALSILRVAVGGSGTPKCPRALLVADEAEFATTTTSTTVPEQR